MGDYHSDPQRSGGEGISPFDDVNQMILDVLIACPQPERVDTEKVLAALPFGRKQINVVEGGLVAQSICQPELGDTSDEAYVANAAITVFVDMDQVLEAWNKDMSEYLSLDKVLRNRVSLVFSSFMTMHIS